MSNGEDWLLRPVLAGMVGYEQLNLATLSLADWADMNEALDVAAENRRRVAQRR